MSLILDALRKLDREKRAPATGMLVVGGDAVWPGWLRLAAPLLVLLALAFGTGLTAALLWLRPSAPAEPAAAAAGSVAAPAQPALAAATSDGPATQAATPAEPGSELAEAAEPLSAAVSEPTQPGALRAARVPVPARKASPSPPSFTLQAISERDGRPVTIINDHLLREGDSLDGARILRISASEVELEAAGGRRIRLSF